MAEIVRMPAILAGATEAAIQSWLVAEGATVVVGQPLAEIETDKATVEMTAEAAGTVARMLVAEGENVAVGDAILVLAADGEQADAIEAALSTAGPARATPTADTAAGASSEGGTGAQPPADPAPGDPEPAPEVPLVASAAAHPGTRVFASPLVRRLAAEHDVDLAAVRGTGPRGRVVRRDLEKHLDSTHTPSTPVEASPAMAPATASPAGAAFSDVPVDRMRRAIARRLTESKTTVPHFYLVADCRVDALLALRASINATTARRISVNDLVLKAVAGALRDVPAANAIWLGDSIRRFEGVDLAVAVATDGGLTTPVVRGADRLPLAELSATVAELAQRARDGRLRQHELEGGSFAVSNLGMYGTTQFSAILNPPQSGILAVGAAQRRPVVGAEGELEVGSVLTVTLSADHRVLDGAVAAQWLAAFQHRIENPLSILL